MNFKIRQLDIDPEKPFEHDLFGREEEIKNLTSLLRNMDPPIVLAVNSPWGTGKTIFIQRWAAYLRQQQAPVLYFNAWETDFSQEPLISFLGEMNHGLGAYIGTSRQTTESWEKAKKSGAYIVKKVLPVMVKVATAGIVNTSDFNVEQISTATGEMATDAIQVYERTKSEIKTFKDSLAKLLESIESDIPLVIFVDELDRCRPSYAIELLERIKHLLNVPGIVFVLAIDRDQLHSSMKAVYGQGLDSQAYLRRFVDIEYSLLKPDPSSYIKHLYDAFGLKDVFQKRANFGGFRYYQEFFSRFFCLLAKQYGLSLREIEQIFVRINLVLRSTQPGEHIYTPLLAFLIVVREKNRVVYESYIRTDGSAKTTRDYFYELFSHEERCRNTDVAIIEGYLIGAKKFLNHLEDQNLLKEHEATLNGSAQSQEKDYSKKVVETFQGEIFPWAPHYFHNLVRRIEMLEQFNLP